MDESLNVAFAQTGGGVEELVDIHRIQMGCKDADGGEMHAPLGDSDEHRGKPATESGGLYGAKLEGVDLAGTNLERMNLIDADLRSANLERTNLNSADLTGANLEGANLTSSSVTGTKFDKAKLAGAIFRGANLEEAIVTAEQVRSVIL